jgi:hypothetical protein
MLDIEQGADIFVRIRFVEENSTLFQKVSIAFKNNVGRCIEEGVARTYKSRKRFPWDTDQFFLKADPFVACENRLP